ncbi:MAG: hypothetical protein JWO77_3747 [Ilumatobacteraceae bacterium]|nr:hypothetical protein [Ilumatobacteraceae bacterium]
MAQPRSTTRNAGASSGSGYSERSQMGLGQRFALVVGIVFLLVGAAGFIPGVTSSFDDLMFAGHDSHAELLGVFQVSVLHNVVHLLFGIAGIVAARSLRGSRSYLLGGGVIYLVLALYGFVIDHASDANFVPINRADDCSTSRSERA